jgi:myo-inositol-1(or 4)-monophosphatase
VSSGKTEKLAGDASKNKTRIRDLSRIEEALLKSAEVLKGFPMGSTRAEKKGQNDIVTAADHAVNRLLLDILPQPGDGWVSEETADDASRLEKSRVWIVDPLDGTREFVEGIPEWCVSIGLVEDGRPVAGGILNPATNELVLGSVESGVTLNGKPASLRSHDKMDDMLVLASRSEVKRGEWKTFDEAPFRVKALGSVAYKLGLVAAGAADATWTLTPKHEWDLAAGVALVLAAGGVVRTLDGHEPKFNRSKLLLDGLLAFSSASAGSLTSFLSKGAYVRF